jgi:hypothetical protein
MFDKFNFTVCAIRKLPMQKIQNEFLKIHYENCGFLHVCKSVKLLLSPLVSPPDT